MKLLFPAFFSFLSLVAIGQNCAPQYLGTKTLYNPQQISYSPVPGGYHPVFINHAGRHGARHLTKDLRGSEGYLLLVNADSAKALTAAGQRLMSMVNLLAGIEEKEYKNISGEGKLELQGIAARMYAENNLLFNTRPAIKVTITKEIRTKQSAEAFLSKWKELGLAFGNDKPINDTTLRFYDMSPAYTAYEEKGEWHSTLDQIKKKLHFEKTVRNIAGRFFTKEFVGGLTIEQISDFVSDIFGFHTIVYSIQPEIKAANIPGDSLDFSGFFSCKELKILGDIDEAEDFFAKGPGRDKGIQVKIAAPLLMDFILTTDEFIQSRKTPVQLRFTHAEAISPFAAIMGIKGASTSTQKGNAISSDWHVSSVIPLSANIQWILYESKEGNDFLLKFLLNEKEVAIEGLETGSFPYYKWSDTRQFYLGQLSRIGLEPGMNFYQWLLTVQ